MSENAMPAGGKWVRRVFHAPLRGEWVPVSLSRMRDAPSLPVFRGLRLEADGHWTVEEWLPDGLQPLAAFLTNSAASVWVFVSLVQQALAGLSRLHSHGFQHGAISPETILCDASGNTLLASCAGGLIPPDWSTTPGAGPTPPSLCGALALTDLRDLGRSFRAVLGGDSDARISASRPDIAPLLAGWIDWLAEPPEGREPESAAQAEVIFGEIRTGKPGVRPWQTKADLPPELSGLDTWQPAEPDETERARRRRLARLAHGSGLETRGLYLLGLVILAVLAGGAWLLNHFVLEKKKEADKTAGDSSIEIPAASDGKPGRVLKLPDDLLDMFSASGGDVEPLPETEGVIGDLMVLLKGEFKGSLPWEEELEAQKKERERIAAGENPESVYAERGPFLYESPIFPSMGQPSSGRGPGDFYLVWRTAHIVLTPEESMTLQSAILRAARYCGVRVMAWTVLPNQAAVVLRVNPPHPLSDELLARRISILRGEKTAARVTAEINARLKAGDPEGATKARLTWTASMGSAAGFFSVIKTVPLVPPAVLQGRPLWQEKALHFSVLNPAKPELLQAAAIVDNAAAKARLVEAANAWPLCSLKAALVNYGPALRSISVLMQRNPQTSLPVPTREELNNALRNYRRYLSDLPPEAEPQPLGEPGTAPDSGRKPAVPESAVSVGGGKNPNVP